FGVDYKIRIRRGEALLSFLMDHGRFGPPGMLGGRDGAPNEVAVSRQGGDYVSPHLSKDEDIRVVAGAAIPVRTPARGACTAPRPWWRATSRAATSRRTTPPPTTAWCSPPPIRLWSTGAPPTSSAGGAAGDRPAASGQRGKEENSIAMTKTTKALAGALAGTFLAGAALAQTPGGPPPGASPRTDAVKN